MTLRNPRRRMKWLLPLLLVACGSSSSVDTGAKTDVTPPKDAISKVSENGPVKAEIHVWPAKPNLNDPIYLRLDVDAPAGISVDAPFQEAGDQKLGRFKVVGFVKDTHRKPDGSQHQEQTYTLEAPASGKHRVPPLRLEMVDSRGDAKVKDAQEILTEEVPLDVAPVATDVIGKDLKPAAGKLDPNVGGVPWLWVVLGISVAAVALSGTLLTMRFYAVRRRTQIKTNAYADAVAKLRALESRGAPTAEDADAWFVELSAIVRNYVEQRYGLRAPELTTEEFLYVATNWPAMATINRDQLKGFLNLCDRVKFAGYRPESQESIETLAAARAFIEDTRVREPSDGAAA